MTPRVDISRPAIEKRVDGLRYWLSIADTREKLLALRAALDAAERERDEARRHANEGRQAEADADRDRHAALVTLNQLFKEHTDMIAERDAASAEGYARGVRDAAAIVRIAQEAATTDGEQDMAGEIHAAILALLPADAAAEKKETGDGE